MSYNVYMTCLICRKHKVKHKTLLIYLIKILHKRLNIYVKFRLSCKHKDIIFHNSQKIFIFLAEFPGYFDSTLQHE